VNPFVHPYHPRHDNLEYRNDVPIELAEGVESYTVTRELTFEFSLTDSDGALTLDWGITRVGGSCRETIYGLHAPIKSEGVFVLEKVTDANVNWE